MWQADIEHASNFIEGARQSALHDEMYPEEKEKAEKLGRSMALAPQPVAEA